MRNPLRTKLSVSDYSEESADDSDNSNLNVVTKEEDKSADSSGVSDSDSEDEKQDNSVSSESEDESESESDSESESSSEDKDEDFDHKWEELRNEAPDTDEITRRLAVCNMDWDRIRAVDLLVCFNSFKPADGIINSVKIYPSEFGLQRMEEEKLKGPPELVEQTLPVDQEEIEDKKGSKYHREKLRQYQINRLKYYYAVVDCDSPETANSIYEQLNGMEYESSSVRFDIRFIPDDMTFDHKPTSIAEKVPSDYKPRLFVTSALQQVKVDLTWDETDPKRREFFQKVFTDIDSVQDDIGDFLASASSESEEEVNMDEDDNKDMKTKDRIAKYKELLKSIEEKEKQENEEKIDVEVTWEPALKEKTEEKVKEKMKKDSLNPFQEMLLKKKEQKKIKKKEFKMQTQDQDSDEDSEEEATETLSNENSKKDKKLAELALISDYKNETELAGPSSLKKKKKKKDKSDDLDGFVADMNDPRFSAMHTSSLFNMVPTEHHNKKNDSNFGLKRPKEKKFKSHGFQKHSKKARYH